MANLATLFVGVEPDYSKIGPSVKRELPKHIPANAGKDAGRRIGMGMSKSLGSGFRVGIGGAARSMFAPIATAAAAIGGFQLFKTFIADAEESAKIGRISAQVIKSTGGVANVSAAQVDDLAEALSNKVAVDDELVQTGANLLLTFKNVRNEAGKGNDIFNQATQAALNLSAAGFGSVESASKMLGKALNDPLRGLTALGRAGVTFTAQQKEQIKTLVEAGDVLGAQRIIMEEIASQVGGAATAAAGPLDRLKVIAANLGEEVGTALLPYLESFGNWLIKRGVPAVEGFIKTFRDDWIPVLKDAGKWLSENKEMLAAFFAVLAGYKIIAAATAAVIAFNAALAANPIGAIVFLLATLVAGFVHLYNHNERFRKAWDKTWRQASESISTIWNNVIKPVFRALLTAYDWVHTKSNEFEVWIRDSWDAVKRMFRTAVLNVANFMADFAEHILDGAEAAFGWLPGLGKKLREAQKKLATFRSNVNRELRNIRDEGVVIRFSASISGSRQPTGSTAAGGRGPGPIPDAEGGDLNFRMRGLNANRYAATASRLKGPAIRAMTPAARAALRPMFDPGFSGPRPAGLPGGRVFPLPPGTYRWGRGPAGHGYDAQDLPVPTGTRVFAPVSGYATGINLGNRSYGKYVKITGSRYGRVILAHLSQLLIGSGWVRAGQVVGRSGSTGNSTGPHLHVEPTSILRFDRGGLLPPGLSLAVNNTGRPERVVAPSEELELSERSVRRLGEAMGRVVLAGIGSASRGEAAYAGLYTRSG